MNTKLTRITIAFASLGLLAACNDGSSSESQTMSVQAMDGYLNQAVVWLDVNGNFERDSDEPQATTGEQGRAEIDLSAFNGDPDSYTLMTEIIQGQTIDEDLPGVTVSRGYMMSAPKGYRQITPLTTMLHAKMEDGLSEAQALAALREDLNQPDLDPKANYIADGNTLGGTVRESYGANDAGAVRCQSDWSACRTNGARSQSDWRGNQKRARKWW